jgi:hypothetical protein
MGPPDRSCPGTIPRRVGIFRRGNNRRALRVLIHVKHLCESANDVDGVYLDQLQPLTVLHVWTRNSHYRAVVTERGDVSMQGGAYLPDATSAHVTSVDGDVLKAGWIGVDLYMVIDAEGRRIVTSPVRMICMERSVS